MAERINEPFDEELMEDVVEVTADGEEIPRQGIDIFTLLPVERGGPGSGHHGHEGREGEVGGSKPSGITNVDEIDMATWDVETDNTIVGGDEGNRTWINDMAKKFASRIGVLPAGVTFFLSDIAAYIDLIYEGEVVRQGFRDEYPEASEDEIDQFIAAQTRESAKLLSNVRGAFVGPESEASTNAILFNLETISESSFMTSDYPQFGKHEGDPLYGSDARRTAVHELSHWIDEMTGGMGEHDDQFLDDIPTIVLEQLKRTAPSYGIASEYRADLLAAYIVSSDPSSPAYGRRHYYGDVDPESMDHLETLLERIRGGMETKSYIFRSIANSVFVLIEGDEVGYEEAILVPEDQLTEDERERFKVVPLISSKTDISGSGEA